MTKKLMILLSLIFVFQITNVFVGDSYGAAKKDDWVVKEKKVSESGQLIFPRKSGHFKELVIG